MWAGLLRSKHSNRTFGDNRGYLGSAVNVARAADQKGNVVAIDSAPSMCEQIARNRDAFDYNSARAS
jgi:precorrin-6B methylase 2